MKNVLLIGAAIGFSLLGGCEGVPSLLPNTDPNLRHTSTQFAADAAKRQPYKSFAPSGGSALANAQFDLTLQDVQILNYSEEDWNDVEVWVNKKYVVFIPVMDKGKSLVKTIPFAMLFDDSGNCFSTNGGKTPIQTVEIYRNGKMYTIDDVKMAD
jgi:hypothetical protein